MAVISVVGRYFLLLRGREDRLDHRVDDLAGKGGTTPEADTVAQFARSALPRMGAPLVPKDEGERTRLQTRLTHAGLYSRQAMVIFLGVKVLVMVAPALVGLTAGVVGLVAVSYGVVGGGVLGVFGRIRAGVF